MRRGIEKLAFLISQEPGETTLGQLAEKFGETTERIGDAIDADKMRRGVSTQLPPIDWGGVHRCPWCPEESP